MENSAESEKTLRIESSARSHRKSSARKNTSESENALRNKTSTRSRTKSSNGLYSKSEDYVDLNDLLDESKNTRFYREMAGIYFTKRKAVEFKERRDRRFLDLTKKR
nr:uncharacterized protein LOC108015199 [Drosophila suzukii]